MSNLFDYSQTPALNNSTPPDGSPEGCLPSTINNTIRQVMANAAGAFTCYTAGGSANAQTVTMSPTLAAYSNKVRIAFIPVAANTGACTLNVNGLGAVSIKMLDGNDPPAGALSGVSVVQHNGTNFVLLNPANLVAVTGSYTATGTGFDSAPTATWSWVKIGTIVYLNMARISGTSNSASFGITGMPAAIRPATETNGNIVNVTDNGSPQLANVNIATSGTITLNLITATAFFGSWTNSGAKAITGTGTKQTIVYSVE